MSAIVAAGAARELSERTRSWIVEATAYCAVAGPDDQAVALGREWGLGHALLATGRDGVSQPLTHDGSVWLAGDVRLDARPNLISSLRASGQRAHQGSTDPELLLMAYYTWGAGFLERVAGDFAFALWDGKRGRLLCGRDQIGVVSLHFARCGDELLVATALDALLLHPSVSDELDEAAIADFLVIGQGDFAATTFRSIRRLPPAHAMEWVNAGLLVRRYWRQEEWPPLLRLETSEDHVSRFRELLEIAVADRITDDRVSVQISGGMDSTSVAAFARRAIADRGLPTTALHGRTMVLGGETGDEEGQYAELVARALGITLEIDDESLLEPLDPFARIEPPMPVPEPTPYVWTLMEYLSLVRCAGRSRVLLTGLPGDGVLRFIPWYWIEWLARGQQWRLMLAFADNWRLFRARPHPHLKASARALLAASRGPKPAAPRWLAPDFARRTTAAARMRPGSTVWARSRDVRSIPRDPGWTAPFIWGSASFSGVPLVLRHPLVDLRLLEFVARLPPEPWLMRKRILREATRDLLPEAVLARPKTPLVRARRTSITPAILDRLAELVRTLEESERFFDSKALIETVKAPGAAVAHPHNPLLLRALGLVHWRTHWRRPRAGVAVEGVRLVLNLAEEGTDGRSTGHKRITPA